MQLVEEMMRRRRGRGVGTARSSTGTLGEVAGPPRLALDVGVSGSSALTPGLQVALVLDRRDVASSPAFRVTPGCLLLRMVAAFALMIAVLGEAPVPRSQ